MFCWTKLSIINYFFQLIVSICNTSSLVMVVSLLRSCVFQCYVILNEQMSFTYSSWWIKGTSLAIHSFRSENKWFNSFSFFWRTKAATTVLTRGPSLDQPLPSPTLADVFGEATNPHVRLRFALRHIISETVKWQLPAGFHIKPIAGFTQRYYDGYTYNIKDLPKRHIENTYR